MDRGDDGSYENIANQAVAEKAVLQGVGSIEWTPKVRLKVALKKEGESTVCMFSQAWSVSSTVLHLSVDQLALRNIKGLVSDGKVESEDVPIGLPVLRNLRVDTKTLLEENGEALNGTYCSLEHTQRKEPGKLGRIMNALLNRQVDENCVESIRVDPNRLKDNYHDAQL